MGCKGVRRGCGMTKAERNKHNRESRQRRARAKQDHDAQLERLIEHTHTLMTQSVLELDKPGKLEAHVRDVYELVCEMRRKVVAGPAPVNNDHGSQKKSPPPPQPPALPWDELVTSWNPAVDLDVANLLPADLFECNDPRVNNAAPQKPDNPLNPLPPLPEAIDIPPFISPTPTPDRHGPCKRKCSF